MIAFIDEHKDRTSCGLGWGIEPICDLLPIAPAPYYAARKRAPSARHVHDCGLRRRIAIADIPNGGNRTESNESGPDADQTRFGRGST